MRIWRISDFADLSGEGGKLYPGRWNMRGTPMVYCADHPSTAMLEILVHLKPERTPDTYQLIEVAVDDSVAIREPDLPAGWQKKPIATKGIGTSFVIGNEAPLLRVPSVIMPQAFNYLLNPNHPDAAKLTIAQVWRYPFDSRLLM